MDNRLLTEQEQKVLTSLKDVKPLLGEPTGLLDGEVEILGVRGRLLTTDMAINESYQRGYQEGYTACNKEWQEKIEAKTDKYGYLPRMKPEELLEAMK